MPEGTTVAPWSGRAFLKAAGVTSPAAPPVTPTGCHPCNDCGGTTPPPVGTTSPPADKWHLYKEWTPDA